MLRAFHGPTIYLYHPRAPTRPPPNKVVLKGLSLSFLPGAKIGVIGGNGAGKSSLLRIMAGEDKDFMGVAAPPTASALVICPRSRGWTRTRTSWKMWKRPWPRSRPC